MPSDFVVGLDLGQAADYTAWAVAERVPVGTGDYVQTGTRLVSDRYGPLKRVPVLTEETVDDVHVRHLERVRQTPYPAIVARTQALLAALAVAGHATTLVVDATGVGRPVLDLLRAAGLDLTPVTITGGQQAAWDGEGWSVPKRDLVATLAVVLQERRLKIAKGLPEGPTLLQELTNFRVKINVATGHDSYGAGGEWREGNHDDLLLALALACWVGQHAYQPWLAIG